MLKIEQRHRDAAPSEEGSPGASEWVASRLSQKQVEALRVLASPDANCGGYCAENGLSPSTLMSLSDFKRGQRGVMAPLMLVAWDFDYRGRRCWGITSFGKTVLARFEQQLREKE